jgi:glycine cleavage system regulatory protein
VPPVIKLVLTVLGDDRAGLVDALAAAVADRRGNWERAQMTRLAGKFAGIVLVAVPPDEVGALREALERLAADGLLEVDVVAVDADDDEPARPADATLTVSGADRPGVLREVARVLAGNGVSIETLDTATGDAPMAGGMVFEAVAALVVPAGVDLERLRVLVEDAVPGFLVDIDRRS